MGAIILYIGNNGSAMNPVIFMLLVPTIFDFNAVKGKGNLHFNAFDKHV